MIYFNDHHLFIILQYLAEYYFSKFVLGKMNNFESMFGSCINVATILQSVHNYKDEQPYVIGTNKFFYLQVIELFSFFKYIHV